MKVKLNANQILLADCMSEISERCYSAGWMTNLEYVLWDALNSGTRKYGHDYITINDLKLLNGYSIKSKSWIKFDMVSEVIAIEVNEWQKIFKLAIQSNPNLLKG